MWVLEEILNDIQNIFYQPIHYKHNQKELEEIQMDRHFIKG